MEAEHQGVVKGWRKRYVLSSCYYLKPGHRRHRDMSHREKNKTRDRDLE